MLVSWLQISGTNRAVHVDSYNSWHSAGSLGWSFPMLKYKSIFFSDKIYLNNFIKQLSETVMAWNCQNDDCSFKNKFIVLFIIIFGTLSYAVGQHRCCVVIVILSQTAADAETGRVLRVRGRSLCHVVTSCFSNSSTRVCCTRSRRPGRTWWCWAWSAPVCRAPTGSSAGSWRRTCSPRTLRTDSDKTWRHSTSSVDETTAFPVSHATTRYGSIF